MKLQTFAAMMTLAGLLLPLTPRAGAAQVPSDRPINLAFAIPGPAPHPALSHLPDATRIGYDAGLAGIAAAIASDDHGIYRTVQGPKGPSRQLNDAANVVTDLGNPAYIGPIIGALYLTGGSGNRKIARLSAIAVARAGIVAVVAKEVFGRKRPSGPQGGSAHTFHPFPGTNPHYSSFPSGHTLTAFAVGTVWAAERPSERYLAYSLAAAVGLSRIVKGRHWPSDVFVGALLGFSQAREAIHGDVNVLNIRF